ncbi:MAG: adenylate kinase [Alphaproteobacteria bacterium]|nr:adenylate kinase [Alphaproteobacteria bacterium]
MKKRVILMGSPGGGKGTQAKLMEKELNVPHLSTGDMFRAGIQNGTEFGLKAKSFMDKGELVPDEVTIGLINERMAENDCKEGFILDGFPRTVPQAEALSELVLKLGLGIEAVLYVKVSDDLIVNRILGRYTCSKCGDVYHDKFKQPKTEGVCDVCGATDFSRRSDDTEETIRTRLNAYSNMTLPVLDYYENSGIVAELDGVGEIEEVFARIKAALD